MSLNIESNTVELRTPATVSDNVQSKGGEPSQHGKIALAAGIVGLGFVIGTILVLSVDSGYCSKPVTPYSLNVSALRRTEQHR